jgi:hypothetical protein
MSGNSNEDETYADKQICVFQRLIKFVQIFLEFLPSILVKILYIGEDGLDYTTWLISIYGYSRLKD